MIRNAVVATVVEGLHPTLGGRYSPSEGFPMCTINNEDAGGGSRSRLDHLESDLWVSLGWWSDVDGVPA